MELEKWIITKYLLSIIFNIKSLDMFDEVNDIEWSP